MASGISDQLRLSSSDVVHIVCVAGLIVPFIDPNPVLYYRRVSLEPKRYSRGIKPDAGRGGGGDDGSGRQASFLERISDPDPGDDWILAEYEFTLREADGTVRVVPEAHRLGSFSRDTWLRLLTAAGFAAQSLPGIRAGNDRHTRNVVFAGHRPGR